MLPYISHCANPDNLIWKTNSSQELGWAWFWSCVGRSVAWAADCWLHLLLGFARSDSKWMCWLHWYKGSWWWLLLLMRCYRNSHYPELCSGWEHKDKHYLNSLRRVACSVALVAVFSFCLELRLVKVLTATTIFLMPYCPSNRLPVS